MDGGGDSRLVDDSAGGVSGGDASPLAGVKDWASDPPGFRTRGSGLGGEEIGGVGYVRVGEATTILLLLFPRVSQCRRKGRHPKQKARPPES